MAIRIYDGSSWQESTNPKIYDGSSWVDVQKGEVYNGSSWEVFFTLFPGPAVAPALTNNARTLKTVTAGVSLTTPPPSGYSVRIKIRNETTGSAYTYLPSSGGTTGTISTTYTSSGLNVNTSYVISAVSEYLKNGSVVAESAQSTVTITTNNVVAPTLSIWDKTTNSVTVRVQHTGGVSRRVTVFRSGDPTTIDLPTATTYTTSNIDTLLTFSGLSSNTRYFFNAYATYEEGPTVSGTSSVFTTTKYLGSRVYVPSVSTYASANETFYFSQRAYGASSVYSSATPASAASDNSLSTFWVSDVTDTVPTYTPVSKSIGAIIKIGNTVSIGSTAHGYTASYGPFSVTISYLINNMSTASYPKGDTRVSCFLSGVSNPPVTYAYGTSTGSLVTIAGSNNTSYNKAYRVTSVSGNRLYLHPTDGVYPPADSSAFGGQVRTYEGLYGSMSLLGGTNISASSVAADSIDYVDSDYGGSVDLVACVGVLNYQIPTGTTEVKKAQGNGEQETVTVAVVPNLPSGATSTRLDAFRFYSKYSSPNVSVWVNTVYGAYYNSSVSLDGGPYSVTGIPLGNNIPPTSSYGGLSNCWQFRFDVDRNAGSTSSLKEAEFQYSYVPLIDPGD